MRVLILGGSGMIGHRLWLACRERFDTVVALHGSMVGQPWAGLFDPARVLEGVDLTDDAAIGATLLPTRPDTVINAAGLVKQRPGGQEALAAITLNALLPHRLAVLCAAGGIRLIHLSTDCVFSGRQGKYREDDPADPSDTYGRSKLLGEVAGPGQLTVRMSAIGRELRGRSGLLEWLLANRGGRVRGFTRAVFSGLTTAELATTIASVLEHQPSLEGVWHVAAPAISKHDLLVSLRDALDIPLEIEPDEATVIDRSLDDARFRKTTGLSRPTWESMISALATDPLQYDALRGEPMLTGKRVLVTGGTGSLGSKLVRRLLHGDLGRPEAIVVFSRDEAKQHAHAPCASEQRRRRPTRSSTPTGSDRCAFTSATSRDHASIRSGAARTPTSSSMPPPSSRYPPASTSRPRRSGPTSSVPEHIVRAIREGRLPVEAVIGISTDKACKPVNVMGMTKAIQERVFIQANLDCAATRFVAARYGNVLASRGSVIPLFHEQIRRGGPVTVTTPEMTRFLMTLDQAVDTVFAALKDARPGEIYVPRVPSARMVDLAAVLIGDRPIETVFTGIRPGEKVHEILVSEEECAPDDRPRRLPRHQADAARSWLACRNRRQLPPRSAFLLGGPSARPGGDPGDVAAQ